MSGLSKATIRVASTKRRQLVRWTFEIEAAQEQVVTSTTTLRSEVADRALVLCVGALGPDGQPVRVAGGVRWSDALDAFYTYLGGEVGKTYDRDFTFEAPATEVTLELLRWPSREPVDENDVVSQVLHLAAWDRSAFMANAAVLVLPRPGGNA